MIKTKIFTIILFFLFVLAIYRFSSTFFSSSIYPLPLVSIYGNGSYKIVILAGNHGNESLPGKYIQTYFITYHDMLSQLHKATFYVIPEVNLPALKLNQRHTSSQIDLNRGYPSQTPINQYITNLISDADLVLDFHEAHEFHRCPHDYPDTLGQTIYVNPYISGTLPYDLLTVLNKRLPGCEQWDILKSLPIVGGSLDEWCVSQKIPYMLFEFAGQEDPIEENHKSRLIRRAINIILHILVKEMI